MIKLGVLGKDVSQSQSPVIHAFIARELGIELTYGKISLPPEKFEEQIERVLCDYDGLNVTIPYKISVISKLSEIRGDAKIFGAVNTVLTKARAGYNTDGWGFMQMLSGAGVDVNGKRVLVLGAGGAGRSVAKKLADAGAKVEIYNRTYGKALEVQRQFGVQAIENLTVEPRYMAVNATGVGMHGTVGVSPVDISLLKECAVAVDLIYSPAQSEFLRLAKSLDKKTVNGAAMLFYQAYYSNCLFTGREPSAALAEQLFTKFSKENVL